MVDLTLYIVHLLPEALVLVGIILLCVVGRVDGMSAMNNGRERTVKIVGVVLFPIILLCTLGILPGTIGSHTPVRFLPLESSPANDSGLLVHDPLSIFFKTGIALLGLIAAVSAGRRTKSNGMPNGSLRFLCGLLCCMLGAFLLAAANDLLIVWGGVEILVLSIGLLMPMESSRSEIHRYGGFFSALILFGILLFYGMFGTTEIFAIAKTLSARNAETVPTNGLLIASFLIFGGVASRIGGRIVEVLRSMRGSFSLNMLALYLLMLLVGYAVIVRLSIGVFPPNLQGLEIDTFLVLLWGIVGIVCGSLAAGTSNIYHGILYAGGAHLGIALLPLAFRSGFGLLSGTTYLVVHIVLTLGVAAGLRKMCGDRWDGTIEELPVRGRVNRITDLFTCVLLLALAGIPFTGGFLARFFLFDSLMESDGASILPLASGVIVSILLLYAHGRWLRALYLPAADIRRPAGSADDPEEMTLGTTHRRFTAVVLSLCVAVAILSGVQPGFRLLWNAVRLSLGQYQE